MKNYILLLSLMLCLVACDKEAEEENTFVDFITASIDGNDFNASVINGFLDNTFNVEFIKIFGTQTGNTASIGFNIRSDIGTGPNTVVADDMIFTFTDDLNNSTDNFLTEGTLNITRNDTTERVIGGNFNFTATDDEDETNVFNVTNGAFRVTY